MITIIYDEKRKDISLQASGHAGYARKINPFEGG